MPEQHLWLTWASFERCVQQLADSLRPQLAPGAVIVAPPRGGLPLAVALSHALGIPFTSTPDGTLPGADHPILWVDDVLDRGATYARMRAVHPDALAAVWVSKQPHQTDVLAVQMCDPDTWVVFPWEQAAVADTDRAAYDARRGARAGRAV